MRPIVAALVDRPAWHRGEALRVEGPDEDALTLVVGALERLRGEVAAAGAPFSRVHVVGPFPDDAAPDVGEALGEPGLEVRRSAGGAAELYEALATAGSAPGSPGPEVVVAFDTASLPGVVPAHGAGAVAFLLTEGPGVRVGAHGERHHPVERRPDAHAWVAAVRPAAEGFPEPRGSLVLRAEAAPPVLLSFWTKAMPALPVTMAAPGDATVGPAPHLAAALDVIEAFRSPGDGTVRVVATIRPDRTTFAGYSVDAGPAVVDARSAGPGELRWPGRDPSAAAGMLARVSEGAYLPKPRYLETRPSRWRFVADRCTACRTLTFPARGICRGCRATEGLRPEPLPRDHLPVEARTTVRPGAQPTEFDAWVEAAGGYDVVLVRLAEGVRATLTVTDALPGTTAIGTSVSTRLRRLFPMEGEWRYGRKAVPEPGPGSARG